MRLALYIKKRSLAGDPRIDALRSELEAGGCEVAVVKAREDLEAGFDALLSLGGDGTFLSAAQLVGDSGIPVLGVNFGRLGFLSEYKSDEIVKPLLSGEYTIEDRSLLRMEVAGSGFSDVSLNEVAVHRKGAAVLGVDLTVDGESLPTCWADGFLVATSSGSTAYSLSVGGPICMPDTKVLILAPIAPHNLNVRPLVLPETAKIDIMVESRDGSAIMSTDNQSVEIEPGWTVHVEMAQFSLKRIRLAETGFVKALTSRLFWGEDIRNNG